jgi:hypothetical protein
MYDFLRTLWRALVRRCVVCGRRVGDDRDGEKVYSIVNGICFRCWFFGYPED